MADILVMSEVVVDPVAEGRLLLIEDHVLGPHGTWNVIVVMTVVCRNL